MEMELSAGPSPSVAVAVEDASVVEEDMAVSEEGALPDVTPAAVLLPAASALLTEPLPAVPDAPDEALPALSVAAVFLRSFTTNVVPDEEAEALWDGMGMPP